MGIVKISEQMHENLRLTSGALSRSINAQAEHWMRIGMLSELHPNLDHNQICRLLVRAEHLIWGAPRAEIEALMQGRQAAPDAAA